MPPVQSESNATLTELPASCFVGDGGFLNLTLLMVEALVTVGVLWSSLLVDDCLLRRPGFECGRVGVRSERVPLSSGSRFTVTTDDVTKDGEDVASIITESGVSSSLRSLRGVADGFVLSVHKGTSSSLTLSSRWLEGLGVWVLVLPRSLPRSPLLRRFGSAFPSSSFDQNDECIIVIIVGYTTGVVLAFPSAASDSGVPSAAGDGSPIGHSGVAGGSFCGGRR